MALLPALSGLSALSGALPDHPDAVRVDDRQMSWEELSRTAAGVAARVAGAPAVAVDATPTLETVAAIAGCLLAGVPAVPVPPDSGPAERDHILADSGATLLLPRDLDDRLAGDASAFPEPPGGEPALILYTSGTTGPPKGVVLSRDAVAAGLDGLAEAWQWSPDDVLVHGLPLYHVHGLVLGVLGALRVGCRLVHTGKPRPDRYAAAGGSLYFGVPTVWSRVCAEPSAAQALAGARLLVSGSAPLPVPVFERLHALTGQRPVERYGMTETLITVAARADGERRPGHVGWPITGVETRLVGEDGQPVPHDGSAIGDLQVRGATLFDGYLNRPDATAAAFTSDGWFRTGDIAAVDADGNHRIVGRASTDLIKSGGYRVGAGEVENHLLSHPAVREAAVVGVPHADLGQEIVAYVVADGVSADALIEFVATGLSWHKRPRRVHLVDALPRNAMGKVQKGLLTGS
ncbi:acyl-CoA synthetase [Planosporangium mesophilum]|uniref:Acyl-CoA synthetase n=1 Tax=Planosporangium mesophilum TaxID=689768 RepID=A0A8J3X659_9ACTN|nr:acyl-CoA synthetase [Planosporangium mesophilum]NJC86596.1 acyl-CoA synthetase [Planosporangium mesophilum]GII25383.1 acyl-CoA synthetase [Planosporangium mesophilum]